MDKSDEESAAPPTSDRREARADYKARRAEFVAERKQKRPYTMTARRLQRNRVAPFKHGLYAKSVTPGEVLRARLARADPALPAILDAYVEAQKGNLSPLNLETARGLGEKFIIRDGVVRRILREGVEIREPILDSRGNRIGDRIKANPLIEALLSLDEQLGITAEAARLSPKSAGHGARVDAITSALERDARIRAASNLQLPPADPDILREDTTDTKAKADDKDAFRRDSARAFHAV